MSEAAKVARVDGRTEASGASRLTGAMLDGIAGGLGRAEMRQRIEAQAREIGELKEQLEAAEARAKALNLRLREVEVDCRIKSAILHADRTGRLESIERRWAWEKRRTAERCTAGLTGTASGFPPSPTASSCRRMTASAWQRCSACLPTACCMKCGRNASTAKRTSPC